MIKRNRNYILLIILLGTLVYQIMLNLTANKIEDRINIIEKNLNMIKTQLEGDK